MDKLAIIGSRTFYDYTKLEHLATNICDKLGITTIVSGGAKGADLLGERFADEKNLKKLIFIPDWDKHGKSAGYKRNVDIVTNSDIVLALWDGESKGTQHSMNIAKSQNKHVIVYNYKLDTLYKYGNPQLF